MAVSANSLVTPQHPKVWTASIGNGDASAWKRLLDASGTQIGAGADGAKIAGLVATSSDASSARNVQLAIVRSISATCTSASPGVVSISGGHNLVAGDQFFFSGTAAATGSSLGTTYFVIAAGLTATAFEFATSAGGSAVNTSSTGTALVVNYIRIIATIPVAITAGTDGATPAANFFNPAYYPGLSFDNDGNPYIMLEGSNSAGAGDFLAVSCTGTVTANKIINVIGQGANF